MALPRIEKVELQFMDQWFANVVDTFNHDMQLIEGQVVALANQLTTFDTAPIAYLNDSLNKLVKNVNDGFGMIDKRLGEMDSRLKRLEGGQ